MSRAIEVTPKCLWVGIGCQLGVSKLAIEQAIESVFATYDLDLATIAGIATLDRKANEAGLVDYCRESGLFLKTYAPERLNSVSADLWQSSSVPIRQASALAAEKSSLVTALVGTSSVAEAAALCAAQTHILLVPKQKFRLDANSGSVTIAIARSESLGSAYCSANG